MGNRSAEVHCETNTNMAKRMWVCVHTIMVQMNIQVHTELTRDYYPLYGNDTMVFRGSNHHKAQG